MKLDYVEVSGFRGFRGAARVDFAPDFTVIDGRNGVGKSTLFDAVEFALTGHITKYRDAKDRETKSGGESVEDYLWWKGGGAPLGERYVEVSLSDALQTIVVRRTPFAAPMDTINKIEGMLVDRELAPPEPLRALCASSIIRDEHIADLSVNMPDTDRYRLLRQAIGVTDGTTWLNRSSDIGKAARDRAKAAKLEVEEASSAVARATRRLDEMRAAAPTDDVFTTARQRLATFTGTPWANETQARARALLADLNGRIEQLQTLVDQWPAYERAVADASSGKDTTAALRSQLEEAVATLAAIPSMEEQASGLLAGTAAEIIRLVELGRHVGLQGDRCPLCATRQDQEAFEKGQLEMLLLARQMDERASAAANLEAQTRKAKAEVERLDAAVSEASNKVEVAVQFMEAFKFACSRAGLDQVDLGTITSRLSELIELQASAEEALAIVATATNDRPLRAAQDALLAAERQLKEVEAKAGRARQIERAAAALETAVSRAANETLQLRLERVLPLMSELYQRLRPHPHWRDISYSLRGGDVRQFLKLEVGDSLNPQFIFSSGQRRATGLAFLLSINLSLAWSRWQTILLDDPVQHVDDFRTVHLAEVMAQLVVGGRQVICAVEDSALGDLLSRRLPVRSPTSATRVSIGFGEDGLARVFSNEPIQPLIPRAFSAPQTSKVG